LLGEITDMNPDDRSTWSPCPEGEIDRMVELLRQRRSLRIVGRASMLAAVILIVATGVGVTVSLYNPKLTCGDVVRLLPEYDQGHLSARLARQVHDHLERCQGCREHHEEMHGDGISPQESPSDTDANATSDTASTS
jgi:hypothetical protein